MRYFITYIVPKYSSGMAGRRIIIECPDEQNMIETYEASGGVNAEPPLELFTAEFDWQPYEYQGEENGSND